MNSTFSISASTKREKQLLLVAGILAILVFVPLLYSLYGSSASKVFIQRNALRQEVQELEKTVQKKAALQKKLTDYVHQSLPPMGATTREKYLNLLTDLVKQCGFQITQLNAGSSGTSSTAMSRTKSSGFQTFSYKLTGTTSLEGLTSLLKRFYEAEVLQLIKTLSIKPVDQSNKMEISMDIEAIALENAKKQLSINWNINENEDFQQSLGDQVRKVNQRALFSMYKPPQPPPAENAPAPPVEQKFSEAMHTFVSGIVDVNGDYQVWIDRRLKGDTLKLKIGDHLDVDGVDCVIRDISFDRVTIGASVEEEGGEVEESRFSIRVKKSFNDFED